MRRPFGIALAAVLLAGGTVYVASPPTAAADPSDGTLKVHVIRDVNGNGSYEAALEVGVQGIGVTVTAPDGKTATGTTGADGAVTVATTGLTGGKYRVETKIPDSMPYLKPAPAGNGLSSMTSFADVSGGKAVELTVGVWNPSDYCQANPTLVTGCQRGARKHDGSSNAAPASRSLVTFPFTQRGTADPKQAAKQGDTGTVFGIAYRKEDKRIFSGAYAKRLAAYGPGGAGAIYATKPDGTTTLFATVPNAGTTQHAMNANFDGQFFGVPGKQALGDIDISEDGSTLYAVNLNDKKLYAFDATGATAGAPKGSYAIPATACPDAADWRPGALGVRDGKVYVGGVCSAESSKKRADLRAVVMTFDGSAFSAPVLTQPLDFPRGAASVHRKGSDVWYPWSDNWADSGQGDLKHSTYPSPLMTDVGVEKNGDLVLDFRDRFGDQGGADIPAPDGSAGTYETYTGGDLNRACRQADGSFAWEGTKGCANNHKGDNAGGEPANVVEYYPGDFWAQSDGTGVHQETSQGAMAILYGETRMPAIVMDPINVRSGGVGWFDRTDGSMQNAQHSNSYRVNVTDDDKMGDGWGKANGLADLEALCDLAPIQIGNRIWFDANRDGIQDGNELPVPGVKAEAIPCSGGAAVATKTTDAKGEYYFGTSDGLKPETCYHVKFDYSGADTSQLPGAPPPASLAWTAKEAGVDRCIDSNVDPATGQATVTTGKPGSVDHCVDGGLTAKQENNKLGDFVWIDKNANGVQDPDEPGVQSVKVTVKDGAGAEKGATTTGPDGKYLFDNLPDGTYQVCFDLANLPDSVKGYRATKPNVGDPALDSDADPATGCTKTTTLGPDKRQDLTLDAGLVAPANKLGDYVWIDKNKDGLQSDGEPGVQGVTAVLKDGAGKELGKTTTDANGKYLFDNLPDGTYQVCFDVANLPDAVKGYRLTKANAGDDAKDSDADPATGCTPTTTLGPDKREDLTLDAGLVAPSAGEFKLGDFVWIDKNKDGLQSDGEPGVPDVTVVLKGGDGKELANTKTGPDGKYLFDKLAAGTYTVCFDLANLPDAVKGYTLTKVNAGDSTKDSDADPTTGCAKPVKLGPDNLTIDAGLVQPEQPVFKLGDFVWIDQNRNGLQDSGEPGVNGVTVTLKSQDGEKKTTTDADGKYLFAGLPAGSYTVCFDVANLPDAVKGYTLTKVNAGDSAKDSDADPATGCAKPVTLGPDNLTLDAGLVAPVQPELNQLGDFVWIDKNGNGIQDPGEPGVKGFPVMLKDGNGKEVAKTTTDANGKYGFYKLPDGTYQVCFDLRNMPAAVKGYVPTATGKGDAGKDSDADPVTGCAKPTTVGPNKRVDLTIDLGLVEPANQVGDFVWLDKNGNGIQDPGEPGVRDVTVVLKDGSGKQLSKTTTGQDGKYLFPGLPDGKYQVCFDISSLPDSAKKPGFTVANQGQQGKNSAADQASGCTRVVSLGPDRREDLTLDAGLRAGPAPVGPPGPKGKDGPLASTGFDILLPSGIGALLLAAGVAFLLAARSRRRKES
ncbi:SdrD B-like domain-containing protein [Amycolatopsis benzoatilytica]|uniref:SdrD B-like domain-containing protein n=1 Tax=Amycolatopsis benzoatilytica TaxID=346045 RepID=UPI0003A87E82|nr:SdrD B-like domain-containing protein [Amycolatopsis benzoatilytica]